MKKLPLLKFEILHGSVKELPLSTLKWSLMLRIFGGGLVDPGLNFLMPLRWPVLLKAPSPEK